jgi:hypothetical protein
LESSPPKRRRRPLYENENRQVLKGNINIKRGISKPRSKTREENTETVQGKHKENSKTVKQLRGTAKTGIEMDASQR